MIFCCPDDACDPLKLAISCVGPFRCDLEITTFWWCTGDWWWWWLWWLVELCWPTLAGASRGWILIGPADVISAFASACPRISSIRAPSDIRPKRQFCLFLCFVLCGTKLAENAKSTDQTGREGGINPKSQFALFHSMRHESPSLSLLQYGARSRILSFIFDSDFYLNFWTQFF